MVFEYIRDNKGDEDLILMHGGESDNFVSDETWYFNIRAKQWVLKESFVWAEYPEGCTDDFEYIEKNNCTKVKWPEHIRREALPPFKTSIEAGVEQLHWWQLTTGEPYLVSSLRTFVLRHKKNKKFYICRKWIMRVLWDIYQKYPIVQQELCNTLSLLK